MISARKGGNGTAVPPPRWDLALLESIAKGQTTLPWGLREGLVTENVRTCFITIHLLRYGEASPLCVVIVSEAYLLANKLQEGA